MRSRTGRPTGRIFFWWLILAVTILAGAEASAATSKTSIVDVLYRADGTPAQGTLLISWPAFTTADGDAIAAASLTVSLGADGSVQAALFPNTGSTPQGTYYKVVVDLDDGTRSTEYWVIPHVPQTTIAAVRSSLVPQSQAMQFVGRDYVDSAIASSMGGFVAVELTGNQTIAGVKTFQNSPQVPVPTNPGDAANQQFVLDTVGNSKTAAAFGTVNAAQYQVNGTVLASGHLSDATSLAKVSQIPTQTSQLTNNSGFISSAGAPVQSVNGQTGAVTVSGLPSGVTSNAAGTLQLTGNVTAQEVITSSDPRYYGAKCDWNGTTGTDDTAAIQTAINTIGGGDLVFPANHRCKISSSLYLLYPNNGSMRIKGTPALRGTPDSGLVADPHAATPFVPLVLAAGAANVDGLVIDGVSNATGKASAGILCWYCIRGKLHQVSVNNVAGDGFVVNDSYFVATSSTSVSGAGVVTLTLTGVPFPIYATEGIAAIMEPGTGQDFKTITATGTWSAASGGTQTVTVNAAKAHTAPFTVLLHANNNGLIFDHSFAQSNGGWGFNVQDDSGSDQNDLRFDKVTAVYNKAGGLLVNGANSNGTIQGGGFQSNTGYAMQFGVSGAGNPAVSGWWIYGPDDNEANTHNCMYLARATEFTVFTGIASASMCPPTATQPVDYPGGAGQGASTIGYRWAHTARGDLIQTETGNPVRGTSIWPYNYNAIVQPTLSGPTIVGGVVQNNVTVSSGGANWTATTPICAVTGDGSGAKCSAVADYAHSLTITSVTITNGGTGYTTAAVSLSGGQDTPLSLHSRGAQPIRLNMAIQGHNVIAGSGGVLFGNGVNVTYPVARIDNLGCLSWSETNSEGQYGKLCQSFAGKNTYTLPDASGTNAWTLPALQQANSYTAGAKQTFGASASTAGFAFGGATADPSSPVEGDIWYRLDLHRLFFRGNGSNIQVLVSGDAPSLASANTFTQKQTFQAGANLGAVTADPAGAVEGDAWYRTDLHHPVFRDNSATQQLATANDVAAAVAAATGLGPPAGCPIGTIQYPCYVAKYDVSGKTANVGATAFYTTPSNGAGTYCASGSATVTTAGTTSTLPSTQVSYTDGDTGVAGEYNQTSATLGNGSIGANHGGVLCFNAAASTNINALTLSYASTGTQMVYSAHWKLTYWGP